VAAKPWVEQRLRWLSRQFGLHLMLERPMILPTEEFFPDPWDGTPRAGQAMFRRVCGYMGVNPGQVSVEFFDDQTSRSLLALDPSMGIAAGTWSGGDHGDFSATWAGVAPQFAGSNGVIRLERGNLNRPSDLVGIMAHELAHQRLLGERRISPHVFDNELLTDLTAVYFGFGVFLANNPRKHTGELSYWPGTQLRKPEYISEPMLGYALAHIAWFRDEEKPAWTSHLRWAPRAVFKQGLRYLLRTTDSTFKPIRLSEPVSSQDDLDDLLPGEQKR
jgi:hypothetical protein